MKTSLAVGFAVLMFGCGGGDGPSVGANQNNVCDEIAEVACYDLYRCCAEGEIQDFLDVSEPRSEDQCRADVRRHCERAFATQKHSLEQKRVKFDSEIMNACLESLVVPDGECATIEAKLPWAEACSSSAWVGTVADGGKCTFPYECASADSYCSASEVCSAKAGVGQPCGPGCKTGLFCDFGTCALLGSAGQPCASSLECSEGLFCDTSVAQPSCAALRATGETCTGNFTCESNQCLPGTCSGTGQACFTGSNCGSHCANGGQTCATDANCGSGTCSIGGGLCFDSFDCASGTCVFPNKCLPGTCEGTVACAEAQITVDYCTGVIDGFPLSP